MTESNREQIEYWNEQAGPKWVAAQAHLDRMLAPVTEALMERAAPRPGERVLDVGCGCGETSLALAGRGADVTGIDVSRSMLARARERAAGKPGLVFREADAATASFEAVHDLVFSRFGVMFFEEPYAAFANLRRALSPTGRLVFCCWRDFRENPWVAVPYAAARPYLPEPEMPPDPRAPGPFAFADPDYVRDILTGAGFDGVDIRPLDPMLHLADSLEGGLAFMQEIGPLSRALAEIDEAARGKALEAVRTALEPHVAADGLNLGGACHIVTARV
ncbi:type 11 methyltransferase [Salinisphaera sp. PC39]|uniref:class I SAM-dependent methyltransferase n=1 Tax=Salinisphaera sp. PC39 TaxID=1304156 RepID=UPI0033412FC6